MVQHVHRIGRASRAGRQGRATNLYDAASRDLVESLLSSVRSYSSNPLEEDPSDLPGQTETEVEEKEQQQQVRSGSVEAAFSRRRGLRKRIRRRNQLEQDNGSSDVNDSDSGEIGQGLGIR